MTTTEAAAVRSQPFTIRYDATTVAHTTQFVLCASDEQLVLECSSGLVAADDTPALPIHSRLAMPWSAAARLHELLGQALQAQNSRNGGPLQATQVSDSRPQRRARLPRFERSHD